MKKNSFAIKDIYEEMFKRTINPIYIIVLSLLSSLSIIKPKINFLENYNKFILFTIGFVIILFSELSYKFLSLKFHFEIILIFLPLLFVLLFYLSLLIKTKFKISYL